MSLNALLAHWRAEPTIGGNVIEWHTVPAREERLALGIPDGLVRVSCGIEDADDKVTGTDGLPLPGMAVRVVDPAGHAVPTGEEGMLQVSSSVTVYFTLFQTFLRSLPVRQVATPLFTH